jgi:hypothetical protein
MHCVSWQYWNDGKRSVSRLEMLDAYKLYEFALEKLFEDKKESIKAIIKRLKKLR